MTNRQSVEEKNPGSPFLLRTGWRSDLAESSFGVRAYGLREVMSSGLIDCHACLEDWLLIHFHTPAEVTLAHTTRRLAQPSLVFWAPGQGPVYGNARGAWTHSWLHCAGKQVRPILQRCGLRAGEPVPAPEELVTEEVIRALHDEMTFEPKPDCRVIRNLVENWLIRLQRGANRPHDYSPKLWKVKQRLETRPDEVLTLAEMAGMAGSSVSHFCTQFREQFGLPPGRYQLRCRMEQARYLLRVRRQRVNEVANALGYADAFVFSKAFRRETGMSPREYREGGCTT